MECEFHVFDQACDEPIAFRGAMKYSAETVESVKVFCETALFDLAEMVKDGVLFGFWVERWDESA